MVMIDDVTWSPGIMGLSLHPENPILCYLIKIIKNNKEKMQLLFYSILNLKDWTKDLLMVRLNLKFPKMVYYSL